MTLYAHINAAGAIDEGPQELPVSWRNVSGLDRSTIARLKAMGWLPVVYVNKAHDPATQVRIGPVLSVGADQVTGTYTVRDKTAQELADDRRAADTATLREAGKDMALVLTELIDWMFVNTAVKATDFTPAVRQAYLGLKAVADRVK